MFFTTIKYAFLLLLLSISLTGFSQVKLQTRNTESILYLGNGKDQPLVVGLGGSEGGNAWTSDYWKKVRDQFLEKGYAFLAVGYFGCENTPRILDRIALDDVHDAILEATKNGQVNKHKIAVVGGSRGADLALLLGCHYDDISCVVGMSSSHAVFPGHTREFNSSCWTYQGKELPYIPVNDEAVPFLEKHDLRSTFEAMLKDTVAEQKAMIPVERIKGPVLLLSGTKDAMIPAVAMGDKMMERLREHHFSYPYQHIVLEGSHTEPTRHFEEIFSFLERNFMIN